MAEIQEDTPKLSLKELILHIIEVRQGIKGIDLVLAVMSEVNPVKFDQTKYFDALDELVMNHEIRTMYYVVPTLDHITKAIYFPKGTKIGEEIINRNDISLDSIR